MREEDGEREREGRQGEGMKEEELAVCYEDCPMLPGHTFDNH